MGWMIALGIVICLAILPIGICAVYNEDGALLSVIVGFLKFQISPRSEKEKAPKRSKEKSNAEKKKATPKSPQTKKKGGSLKDFLPLVDTLLSFLGEFRRKLRVKRLEMSLVMAGDDPCDLAVNYGKAWVALGNLMPLLEQIFVICKRDLEVQCDFTADKTRINARIDLTIPLGRILYMAIFYGVKLLCQFQKISKTKKGGVK